MSSKLADSNLPDNQYSIDKLIPASAPLDNQLLSFNKEYEKHQNLVTNNEYSIVKNKDVCDNTIQLNNLGESSQEDNSILDKNSVFTPRNCRKFSPEKIKGNYANIIPRTEAHLGNTNTKLNKIPKYNLIDANIIY